MVRSAWGAPQHNPASRFLEELPDDLVDWRRTEAAQTTWSVDVGVEPVRRPVAPAPASQRRHRRARVGATAKAKAGTRPVPSLEPGDRVVHDTFGMGTVVTVEGVADKAVASIDFGSDGVKRLLLRYSPVEKL